MIMKVIASGAGINILEFLMDSDCAYPVQNAIQKQLAIVKKLLTLGKKVSSIYLKIKLLSKTPIGSNDTTMYIIIIAIIKPPKRV